MNARGCICSNSLGEEMLSAVALLCYNIALPEPSKPSCTEDERRIDVLLAASYVSREELLLCITVMQTCVILVLSTTVDMPVEMLVNIRRMRLSLTSELHAAIPL